MLSKPWLLLCGGSLGRALNAQQDSVSHQQVCGQTCCFPGSLTCRRTLLGSLTCRRTLSYIIFPSLRRGLIHLHHGFPSLRRGMALCAGSLTWHRTHLGSLTCRRTLLRSSVGSFLSLRRGASHLTSLFISVIPIPKAL